MSGAPRLPSRDGFTLPEVIIGALITSCLIIILGTLYRVAIDGISMINIQGILQTQLTNTADFIMKDASLAFEAPLSCCPPSNPNAYTASPTTRLISL